MRRSGGQTNWQYLWEDFFFFFFFSSLGSVMDTPKGSERSQKEESKCYMDGLKGRSKRLHVHFFCQRWKNLADVILIYWYRLHSLCSPPCNVANTESPLVLSFVYFSLTTMIFNQTGLIQCAFLSSHSALFLSFLVLYLWFGAKIVYIQMFNALGFFLLLEKKQQKKNSWLEHIAIATP